MMFQNGAVAVASAQFDGPYARSLKRMTDRISSFFEFTRDDATKTSGSRRERTNRDHFKYVWKRMAYLRVEGVLTWWPRIKTTYVPADATVRKRVTITVYEAYSYDQ
jgi:hypothetical protein